MLAFVEVLAVPVVVPQQKMTSESTAFKSGGAPYGRNRSKRDCFLKKNCTVGRESKILGSLMEEREKFEVEGVKNVVRFWRWCKERV